MKSKIQRGFKDDSKKLKDGKNFQRWAASLLRSNKKFVIFIIQKLFRAIKLIFTKNKVMKAIGNQKKLEEFVFNNLSEFHSYCTGQKSPWPNVKIEEAIKITKPYKPADNESIEFTSLDWNFLLKRELYPFEGVGYFKTYQIVLDENNYPNKKLIHIPNLDIFFGLKLLAPGNFRFQEVAESGETNIIDFPPEYLIRLYQALAQIS